MPDGGELTIEAFKEGSAAVVRVSDTGQGMDDEMCRKCFDPFFTTKEVGKGTGLGLSTSYGIVRSHDGEILVESGPGKGTTFTVRIPLTEGDAAIDTAEEKPIRRGQGQTILVVDDEIEIQTAMVSLLECLGYRPVIAGAGSEALERYRTERPEAVLMDVNLPEENGITCGEKILEMDPNAQIAVLSGYHENGPELEDRQTNGIIKGYLTKPVDIHELSDLLARLVK
jgi:two-component system cell cycle sensor histidine kinase/response regulator CckA